MKTRHLGGLVFTCHEPGCWLGAEGRLALLHMMQGTKWGEWHLFRTRPGKVPRDPFASVEFWGWDELTYTLTMFEMDKTVHDLRERSRAMLPHLEPEKTIVRCGKELRLVTAVHPDGDDIGAILDVESSYSSLAEDDQWSTYGCVIEDLPASWPKWQRRATAESERRRA